MDTHGEFNTRYVICQVHCSDVGWNEEAGEYCVQNIQFELV